MIRILHIDDKRGVSAALDEMLQETHDDAVLKWFDNFSDGIEALKENPSMYNGIILDAKCFLNREDESLDEQYVIKAINDIEGIFHRNNIWMPFCVLSGFKDKLSGYFKVNNIVAFDKDEDELNALKFIINNQYKVTRNLFNQEFPDLLPFLYEGHLEKHSPNILLQLFGVLRNQQDDPSIIKAQIAQVRPILEKVMLKLYEIGNYEGSVLIPEEYVSTSGTRTQVNNLIGCFIYLDGDVAKGKKGNYQRSAVWPSHIRSQCMSIYNVTSSIGNHTNSETGSIYTLSAMFYSLIDLLYWYKEFIKNYS